MLDRIVLYGSLMRGEPAYRKLRLNRALRFLRLCRIAGRLVDLGPYPGLIEGHGSVMGQLFVIADPSVVARLDKFEGYDPSGRRLSLYVRERVAVGGGAEGWVYRFAADAGDSPIIASGDWATHHRHR